MDNPEKWVTLSTQDTGERQTKHRKLKRRASRPHQKRGAHEKNIEQALQYLVSHQVIRNNILLLTNF